ncbi:MAG: hypothetical protein WC359_14870 [Dehalococcoidia bacterium]
MSFKVLAGCNKPGSMNWGDWASKVDEKTIKEWLENLGPYFGKTVYLAGGGGNGYSEGVLESAVIDNNVRGDGRKQLRVQLRGLKSISGKGIWTRGEEGDFAPIIGSWQILAKTK